MSKDAKTKIYVACSLTQAPEEFKAAVEALKNSLRSRFEILDFIGLVGGTPADVYHWDVQKCVGGCDLLVAICDYPAIGLGYEIATAVEKLHKPVLAVAGQQALVSRLVLGIDAPGYSFERYDSPSEIEKLIDNKLKLSKVKT